MTIITKEEAKRLISTKLNALKQFDNPLSAGENLLGALTPKFTQNEGEDKEADAADLKPTVNYIVTLSSQATDNEANKILNELDNLRGCLGQQNFYTIIGSTFALFVNFNDSTQFLSYFLKDQNGINFYYETMSVDPDNTQNENMVALANSQFQEIFLTSLYNFCDKHPNIKLNLSRRPNQELNPPKNNNNQNISIKKNVNTPKSQLNNNNQKLSCHLHESIIIQTNEDELANSYSGVQPFDGIISPSRGNSENQPTNFFAPGANKLRENIANFKNTVLQFLLDRKAEHHNRKEKMYQDNNLYQL